MDETKPKEPLELLSIGDATMDVYVTPTESESVCQMDHKESLICFTYGDKIPVRTLDFSVGGNAANNAVGAKRLGIKCGLVSTLGGDLTAGQIIKVLEQEGVDLTYVISQPTAETNFSVVINYSGERTILSYHAPRSYEFPIHMAPAPWVYLTSMSETFAPFYKHFMEWYAANPGIKLAFNPGSRQLRAGLDTIKDVLEATYLIYVNRQEAEMLTGLNDSLGKEKDLLQALTNLGPKSCVITDSRDGAYAYHESHFYKAGTMPIEPLQLTGAGDAFGSGMVSALIKGKEFTESLLWGAVNAASVIGQMGPQKGLIKENEIGMWLDRARGSGVKVEEI